MKQNTRRLKRSTKNDRENRKIRQDSGNNFNTNYKIPSNSGGIPSKILRQIFGKCWFIVQDGTLKPSVFLTGKYWAVRTD